MSKNRTARVAAYKEQEAEEARSQQMMNANHAEKIALAREEQAKKIIAGNEARAAAIESGVDADTIPVADRFNTPAVYEERLWRTIPATVATLGKALNQLEQEGWQLVNITTTGPALIVVGARKMQYALPEEPEVEAASEETTSANAPDTVTPAEMEELRRQWAEGSNEGMPEPEAPAQEPLIVLP